MSNSDRAALHAALDAYDSGAFQQAEPTLRTLAAKYPSSFEANEALGSLYAESGELLKAIPFLLQSCHLSPRQPVAHANLGAAYLKLGKLDEATEELGKAAALDPHNPSTQSNLGQALLSSKRPAEAVRAFAAAAESAPNDPGLTYNLALALFQSGAAQKASDLLQKIPPEVRTDEIESLAGDAAERTGDFQLALLHFQAAAQKSPTDPNLYALAIELLRHWNWAEAIRVATYAGTRYPASNHFQLAAGIAYYANNQYPDAVQSFSTLLAADPNNSVIADLLGRSCSLLPDGQSTGCAAMYDFAQAHSGNAVTTTYAAVAILHGPAAKADLDKAASLLQTAITASPGYAEAYLQLGKLEQTRQNWQESAALLERSIALRPTSAEAHYRLSRAYAHLGRHTEAMQQVELNQSYAKQASDSLNARMQEVMKFVLDPK